MTKNYLIKVTINVIDCNDFADINLKVFIAIFEIIMYIWEMSQYLCNSNEKTFMDAPSYKVYMREIKSRQSN